jgi:tape measure domain-containing protein
MVGHGYVQITPSMRGFRKTVNREVEGTAGEARRSFSARMKSAGRESGQSLGTSLKQTLTASAGDLGAGALKGLESNVAKAAGALSTARLKQQDEAGKVRVAEAKLAEAMKKYPEGASQIVAAEERVETARRRHKDATDKVTDASDRLRTAQDRLKTATDRVADSVDKVKLGSFAQHLRDGWEDARVANSQFSGVASSIGGIARAVSNASGLSKLGGIARAAAQRTSTAFGSLATMIGGKLSAGWTAASSWLSGVAGRVGGFLAPVGQLFSNLGTKLATPFVNLGTKIAGHLKPVTDSVKAFASKLPGPMGSAASGIGSTLASGLSGLVGKIGTVGRDLGARFASSVQSAATAGVAGVAAAVGAALAGGMGRLTSLDESIAKMKGLGFASEDIEKAMQIANDAAVGTSFAMNDLASAAAMAMTAGIKPGEQLVGYLDSIKGAATASGAPVQEIASIFGKVATAGTAYTTEIQQLADRQIPIWGELAEVMGVPAAEVKKLASEGKIDLVTFQTAVTNATGGMAEEMGKTLPAKIANTRSAFSRLGMALLGTKMEGDELVGGLFPAFKSFFDMVRTGVDAVTALIGPFFEKWTTSGGGKLVELFDSLTEKFTSFKETVSDGGGLDALGGQATNLAAVLAPVGAALAAIGIGGLAPLLARIPVLGGMLGGLGGAFAFLGGPIGIAAAAIAAFMATGADSSALVSGLTGIIDSVLAMLPGLIDTVVKVIPGIVDGILKAVPELLTAATGIVQGLIGGIVKATPLLAKGWVLLLNGLINAVVQNLPMIIQAAVTLVTTLIQGIVQALPLLIQGSISLITGLIQGIVTNLPMIIEAAIQLVMSLIEGIISMLPTLIEAAISLVTTLITAIAENLPLIIEAGIGLLLALVTGLLDALPELITAVLELIPAIVTTLLENLPQLVSAALEMILAIAGGLIQAIPELVAAIPEIIAAVFTAFTEVDWLSLGGDIIAGIVEGIVNAGGQIWDALLEIVGDAWQGVKDFFGIASPSRLMRDTIGKQIPAGLAVGIKQGASESTNAALAMSKQVASAAQTAATYSSSVDVQRTDTGLAVTDAAGLTVNFTVNGEKGQDVDELVDIIMQRLGGVSRRFR